VTNCARHRLSRRARAALVFLLGLAVFEVVGTFGASRHQHAARRLDLLAIVLVLLGVLALSGLRRRPVVVMWVVVAATLAYLMRGYAYGPVVVPAAIAVFAAVVTGHRLAAWAGFGTLYVGHLAARDWLLDERLTWGPALGVAAWGLVILVTGEVVRASHERRSATSTARRERGRRQANEERLRIARELHDVVAHHMSLINVQASVALHLVDRRPDQVETALGVIKDASKEALVEMRSLVGVLRDETDRAPRAPTAMLDSLDDLVERSELAGLTIRTHVVGEVVHLPAAVDLAAFRIIQEAVTNVVRHAGARHAEITIDYRSDELRVQVDDDGVGPPKGGEPVLDTVWTEGAGSGLRGMQERAVALGGTLTLGRATAGGVRVLAVFPLESTS
jgi:signal transduction histidine kinase